MSQPFPSGVRVRTPATSANLGPGFDTFGLALGLYDEVDVEPRDDGDITVDLAGEGADEVPRDGNHLVVRAMRAVFERVGRELPGLDVRCRNRVPHGRGLGSSASAIVGGVTAATVLLGEVDPADGRPDRDRVFQLAADIEGHPDNVAPCVYGGFTLAWHTGEWWRCLRVEPSLRLRPVVCVPERRLSTEQARGLLPESVPRVDAVFTAGRAALMTAAVSGQPELLLEATQDRLHESYRAPAMPESAELARALRETAELPAVISGAGPTVLVFGWESAGGTGEERRFGDGLVDSVRELAGKSWHIRPLQTDPAGAWISSPRSSTCGEE